MEAFPVRILAADRTFYDGLCESLTISTSDGEQGILAHHSDMIAAVSPGVLRYRAPGEPMRVAAVSPGMLKVEDGEVLMLLDSAEYPEEIDEARARREADEAREALLQQKSRQEYQLAQASLARAVNRLRVKSGSLGER